VFAVPGGFHDARRRRCVDSRWQWSSRPWRSRSGLSRFERQPAAQQLVPCYSVQAWRSDPGASPPGRGRGGRPSCGADTGGSSGRAARRGACAESCARPISRPVAVQSLASCGAKQRGHANNDDGPYRPLGDAADCGSALDNTPGTASRARSELEIPASAGGLGRSRHCVAHDGPGHQPSVVPPGAAIAMLDGDDGPRDARRKGPGSDRASMHGAQGADPRSLGPEGAAPSLESLVAIFNDARRSLVGQTGGFSLAQGRMVLTVLGIAGPRFLPSPRQLRAMRNCPGGCGDAKAFDSLLVSTVRILQGGNGSMVSPVDTAARLVQGALEAHACSGACQPSPRSAPPTAAAVRYPAPPPAELSSAGHRSPVARSPSPPHKRFRECASEEEDRREMRWVPAAAGRARPEPSSVAR